MNDGSATRRTKSLGIMLKIACVLPFATGLADTLGGTRILATAGAAIPPDVAADPIVNNQIAFWGAIWFGYGIALWWASNDIFARVGILRILFVVLFLSGLGRAASVLLHGWAGTPLTVAMIVELAGSVGLAAWLGSVMRSQTRSGLAPASA